MPNEYGLEKFLSPAGQQTYKAAVETMRKTGSSRLQSEHWIMVFSGMYPQFSQIGAGPEYFNRVYNFKPETPRFEGEFTVDNNVQDIIIEATTNDGKSFKRAGPLNILERLLENPQSKLRTHIQIAHMEHTGSFNEDIPDDLWKQITGQPEDDGTQRSKVA